MSCIREKRCILRKCAFETTSYGKVLGSQSDAYINTQIANTPYSLFPGELLINSSLLEYVRLCHIISQNQRWKRVTK